MSASILLIGNIRSKSTLRLKEEADKLGLVFDMVQPSSIALSENTVATSDTTLTRDFLEYDVYFFRGITKSMDRMHKVAHALAQKGKRVVEQCLVSDVLPHDKDVPQSKNNLYTVPLSHMVTKDTAQTVATEIGFPLVFKKLHSSKGKGVRKVSSQEELTTCMQALKGECLLQTYYEIAYDTRVLVVGDKVLGGINRHKREGEDFLTTAPGGLRESVELTQGQRDAALEATRLHGLEISGIDMFTVNGEIYIIEVNASPQFRVFEKYTGMNVAKEILEYLSV